MIKPMPAFFLIRIPQKEQKERLEKVGNIYLHPNYVYMTRGMQCGEIVAIGRDAQETLPDAKIGHTLLFHHFVESAEKSLCVHKDDEFNYYVVTAMSHNGQNNQTYGVFDGHHIIPHPDYIFLETESAPVANMDAETFLDNTLQQTNSGLLLFKDWKVDRRALSDRMENIKYEIESLTQSRMTPQIERDIKIKEAEMNRISALLNKKKYEIYTLVAANPFLVNEVLESFGICIEPGSSIYMLNIACQTHIEFQNTEYIVAKSIHFGMPVGWINTAQALL